MNEADKTGPVRLGGRSVVAARVLYALFFALVVAMFALALSYRFVRTTSPCDSIHNAEWAAAGSACSAWYEGIDELGLTPTILEGYFLTLRLITALPLFALSLLLIRQARRELRVFLFAGLLLLFGAGGNPSTHFWDWASGWSLVYPIDSIILDRLEQVLSFAYVGGATLFALLFPDGRFVPRWTRWYAPIWLIMFAANVFQTPLSWTRLPSPLNVLPPIVTLLLLLWAVTLRYRHHTTDVQRQQIKWATFGLLIMFIPPLLHYSVSEIYTSVTGVYLIPEGRVAVLWELGIVTLTQAALAILGICFGFAVLRRRLWAIDNIVNRTLTYSLLSAVLAAIYYVLIVTLQTFFRFFDSEQPAVILVLSTLAIAALVSPLRRWLQDQIDRRFYRRRYDALLVLQRFSEVARDEVELERLSTSLINTIQEVMKPAQINLWLKPEEDLRKHLG